MSKSEYPISSLHYVNLSDIVPENWKDWFYTGISTDAPFSWGDNNYTLVDGERFLDHAIECIEMEESYLDEDFAEKKLFLDVLKDIATSNIFINLEG